ncbi:MAG: alanine racemase [Thermomicrobiales bacterium]|nr:alanine racemase [Thermomicrobiales bacterium]
MLTTLIGLPVSELDTPALLIDLDALESNINQMAADIKERGASWRPHSKSHKCPAIAHKQVAAGAIGVACAKLGEAEVMAANGIKDILVPNQIVGPIKARRVAAVAAHTDICVSVDCLANVEELDAAAIAAGTRPRVVIEVNTGMDRAGVEPREATLELAKKIAGRKGVRFAGIMTWEGHCWKMPLGPERDAGISKAMGDMLDTAEMIRAAGIDVEVISVGGTATYLSSAGFPGITEVQAGGGIFGDLEYLRQGANVKPAMTLMAQVTSRPTPTRIIHDAGRKTIDPTNRAPEPRNIDVEEKKGFSAEHGTLFLKEASDSPKVGDRIEFSIGYSDQCNHLHENFYGIRNGRVESVWPILGRGKIQ